MNLTLVSESATTSENHWSRIFILGPSESRPSTQDSWGLICLQFPRFLSTWNPSLPELPYPAAMHISCSTWRRLCWWYHIVHRSLEDLLWSRHCLLAVQFHKLWELRGPRPRLSGERSALSYLTRASIPSLSQVVLPWDRWPEVLPWCAWINADICSSLSGFSGHCSNNLGSCIVTHQFIISFIVLVLLIQFNE